MERELEKKEPFIGVYVGVIPDTEEILTVYPQERAQEIFACKNERVRMEKYYAWKLLEYALQATFGADIRSLRFQKSDTGQWLTDEYCFSLSHSGKAVAVAVSKKAVGVDVEKDSDKLQRVCKKVLSDGEKEAYKKLDFGARRAFLLEKWTQKESVFKTLGKGAFLPKEIDTEQFVTQSKRMETDGERYLVTVAGDGEARWSFVGDLAGII